MKFVVIRCLFCIIVMRCCQLKQKSGSDIDSDLLDTKTREEKLK
jgi:hypothetical protein